MGGQIRLGFGHRGATQESHDGAVVALGRDLCEGPRRVVLPIGWHAIAKQSAEKLYRAVYRNGETIDFMLSEYRDEAAALRILAKAISSNKLPRACAIGRSGANTAGLNEMNAALRAVGSDHRIRVYRSKFLNNIGLIRRFTPL